MKIDDTFSIAVHGSSFTLIEEVDGFKLSEDRKERIPAKTKTESFYGSLYQALQGYMKKSIAKAASVKDARKIASRVMTTLDDLEAEIKEKFCIYVKKA